MVTPTIANYGEISNKDDNKCVLLPYKRNMHAFQCISNQKAKHIGIMEVRKFLDCDDINIRNSTLKLTGAQTFLYI